MNSNNCIDNEDLTPEDLINDIPSMSDALMRYYEEFDSCIEKNKTCIGKFYSTVLDLRNLNGYLSNQLKSSLDQVGEEISENRLILEEKILEIEQLKKITKDLEESNSQDEHKAELLRQRISHLRDKTKNLEEKKDKILVYKLLTNTNFCYEGANVSGYVFDQKTKKISWFDLDPEKLSQKKITEQLYEALEKVSHASTEVQNVEMDQRES